LIDNLLVRIHFIIAMIRWTGLAPWEYEFPLPGSLASTFLNEVSSILGQAVNLLEFDSREIGILLPNNQRQHRTLHTQKHVLPYSLC